MELLIALCISACVIVSLIIILKDSISDKATYDDTPIFFITMILNIIIAFCLIINLRKPKAIDVYQDKTTLEITYKDKIPIDSVVVWKNK